MRAWKFSSKIVFSFDDDLKRKYLQKSLKYFSQNQAGQNYFAKDCLLTLVKSRLALGSPGCSVGCDHAENG